MVWVTYLLLVHLGLARGCLLNIRFSFAFTIQKGLVLIRLPISYGKTYTQAGDL